MPSLACFRLPSVLPTLCALGLALALGACDTDEQDGGASATGPKRGAQSQVVVAPPALTTLEGTSEAPAPLGEGFLLEPYLTWLDDSSARLNWRLKTAQASRLEYGRTFGFEAGAVALEEALQHGVLLQDLAPDTVYHYRVDNAYQGSFRTEGGSDTIRFAVIGHTHGTEQFGHYPDRLTAALLRDLGLHFGVHCGDLTYFNHVPDFSEHYFDVFGDFLAETPMYVSPGNHDAGWPFMYGKNLRPFKELFTFPYPEAIREDDEQAYYLVEKGGLKLLFLSYTSDMGEGSLQRRWIKEQLEGSNADFHVLVYGGANRYYKEDEFIEYVSQFRVDAIFNGDGSASQGRSRNQNGIPIYFTGTRDARSHPIVYCEYQPEVLTIKYVDSAGAPAVHDWLPTQRRPEKLVELTLPEASELGVGNLAYRVTFDKPIRSDSVHGLRVAYETQSEKPSTMCVFVEPHDYNNVGERGFRTPTYRVSPAGGVASIPFVPRKPGTGEVYGIAAIRVKVTGLSRAEALKFTEAYIY